MSSIDSSKDHVPEYGRSRSKKGKGGGGGGFKSERRTDSLERGSNSSAVVDGSGTWSVASSKRKTGGGGGSGGGGGGGGAGGARIQFDDASKVARVKKAQIVKREIDQSAVPFLRHLPQYDRGTSISEGVGFGRSLIHPAVQRLGVKYAEGGIFGGHERCVALVDALEQVVAVFTTTDADDTQDLRRELDKQLKRCVQYVVECRPMSVSMGNFVRYLKAKIAHLPPTVSEEEGKAMILQAISDFRDKKLDLPMQIIAEIGSKLIVDEDKVVVYAYSHVVHMILKAAVAAGKFFTVAVIDSRPRYEGRQMAQVLDELGVPVEYGLVNGANYLMQGATKVLLGAHSLMSNGAVTSRVGTASVALLARSHRIPILVACETIKFSERVQLDSIAFNELGDPNALLPTTSEREREKRKLLDATWKSMPNLRLINLVYDITPIEYIEAVITEVGLIPPSSVPVVVQEYLQDSFISV